MTKIKEDLIHYIWKTKSFNQQDLRTTNGQELQILSFGLHNDDAGPDFLNARIDIDGTIWAGHVEIHIRASDWLRHRHDADAGYQNVILHVVMEADVNIKLSDQTIIPCLELKPRVDHKLIGKYQLFQNNKAWIPCESMIQSIQSITKETTKDRALAQRLTSKSKELEEQLKLLNNDLNELIYQRLAWAFGLKVNADAMLALTKILPYKIIQKHRDQHHQIEALLFGQSGLVSKDMEHPYVSGLLKEYAILKAKFKLRPMQAVQWKYSRLRPPAFPTIRLAQFSQFLYQAPRLDELIFSNDLKMIHNALDIQLAGYWQDHYRFGLPATRRNKNLGDRTKSVIIINVIVPVLFMYGMIRQSQDHKEMAVTMLEGLPAEQNAITKRWTSLDMNNTNAADSQALLQLKKVSCNHHQCMQCPIGHKIIST